jgi:hypothetical protein
LSEDLRKPWIELFRFSLTAKLVQHFEQRQLDFALFRKTHRPAMLSQRSLTANPKLK